jgi:CTP synthase
MRLEKFLEIEFMTKYIFVTGGVVSSLGKGLAASSIGCLLEARGMKVQMMKLDPYINVDPGTMSPFQHGECYVTDDGAETDLDLGHYERFTHAKLTQANNWTSGRIYLSVINKERSGEYLGKTIQVIPHITDEIKAAVKVVAEKDSPDVLIVEIGGTVGDIESLPFLEAIRQLGNEEGRKNSLFIHVTLVPFIAAAGELKTKPTQHSVRELREIGIAPDVLLCRSEHPISRDLRDKIALFCNVEKNAVISALDVPTIYEVPLAFHEQELDSLIVENLGLMEKFPNVDLKRWRELVSTIKEPGEGAVKIAIVGKYVELEDSYKSLREALTHAGVANNLRVNVKWIESESLMREDYETELQDYDAILVPGGFGKRGVSGMLRAIKYARKSQTPYFGICLGMQTASIEFARNVCDMKEADSTEFNPETEFPVIFKLRDLVNVEEYGGTMRLGACDCNLKQGSLASEIYGNATQISERHRHRYEFNPIFKEKLESRGLVISGLSPDGKFVEIVELPRSVHPYFVGVQFHPEYKSKPLEPHPIFVSFVKAANVNRLGSENLKHDVSSDKPLNKETVDFDHRIEV